MVESNKSDDVYIFCFGSNGPKQLVERIGAEYDELMSRTVPAIAKGWLRGFKGSACTWGDKSTATMFETGNEEDTVCGTAVKMTQKEIEALDPYEAYPFKYIRKELKLTAFKAGDGTGGEPEQFEIEDAQAYIIRDDVHNTFDTPSDKYRIACCKTIYTNRVLLGKQS